MQYPKLARRGLGTLKRYGGWLMVLSGTLLGTGEMLTTLGSLSFASCPDVGRLKPCQPVRGTRAAAGLPVSRRCSVGRFP
jgi:hypothetical protein